MAAEVTRSRRSLKRSETKKSHSWWWDSHISPKNSKWLAENLQEMDDSVKRMLKLIEEDGDSFAKKAEMYYHKRPELINLVEEFYRMYRSLAERYDHVTGELRKNLPFDLQSQGSTASDISSEITSTPCSAQERPRSCKPGPRAAGFDFFLGSAKSDSDACHKDRDDSSYVTETESDSDDSSINNSRYMETSNEQKQNRKITELEMELREAKEKLRVHHQQGDGGSSYGWTERVDLIDLPDKVVAYEVQLKDAHATIQSLDEEIFRLKINLQKYEPLEVTDGVQSEWRLAESNYIKIKEGEIQDQDVKLRELEEKLRLSRERLEKADQEVNCLKHELEVKKSVEEKLNILHSQLESAHQDALSWKSELEAAKREMAKLHEKITLLKTSLSDRDIEVRDLKAALSDAEHKIFPEKAPIKAELSKLLEEQSRLLEQLREYESRNRYLADDIRRTENEKTQAENKLNCEIERLKSEITEKSHCITRLADNLNAVSSQKDELHGEIKSLKRDISQREQRMEEAEKHLQRLHMEHARLIGGAKQAHKQMAELRSRVEELENEVERQRAALVDGAEEKREAIRQLCFSLEHYKIGYSQLHKAIAGRRKVSVFAS